MSVAERKAYLQRIGKLKAAPLGGGQIPAKILIDGEERHTTNSEGKPIADTEEGVRNFYKWFGDSEVVDADGKPLVVYHGTNADFHIFDLEPTGSDGRKTRILGNGFYFTSDPEQTQSYGKRMIPAYLQLENPRTHKPDGMLEDHSNEQDGTIARGTPGTREGHRVFVVKSPTQIKSATDNRGTFDGSDPNILHAAPLGGGFSQQVEDLISGRFDRSKMLNLGETPDVLQLLGARPLPLVMKPSVADKVLFEKHGMPVELFKQIPNALKNPIFIFQSHTVAGAVTAIIDIKHDGQNILVAVLLDGSEKNHSVNLITSSYGKSNNAILGWMRAGSLLYMDTQKSLAWQRSIGLQLPKEVTKRDKGTILTEADVVKWKSGDHHVKSSPLGESFRRDMANAKETQDAFRGEGKLVGRPDLANPARDAASREFVDRVDEARKAEATQQTRKQWEAEGARRLRESAKAVEERLLAAADSDSVCAFG